MYMNIKIYFYFMYVCALYLPGASKLEAFRIPRRYDQRRTCLEYINKRYNGLFHAIPLKRQIGFCTVSLSLPSHSSQ